MEQAKKKVISSKEFIKACGEMKMKMKMKIGIPSLDAAHGVLF